MFCPNCGTQLKDGSNFCVNCGNRVADLTKPQAAHEPAVSPVQPTAPEQPAPPVAAAQPAYSADASNNAAAPNSSASYPAWGASANAADAQPQQNYRPYEPQQPQQQWAPRYEPEEEKPKKKKGLGKKLIAVVVVLAILAGAAVAVAHFAGDSVSNFAVKTFSSSKDYYKYVETRGTDSVATTVAALYGNVRDVLDYDNKKSTVSFSVEVGDELVEMLSDMSGYDFTWFEGVGMEISAGTKDGLTSASMGLNLGSDDLAELNCVVDLEEGVVYLQVPQLSQTYASIDIGDMIDDYMGYGAVGGIGGIAEATDLLNTIYEATPDQKTVEKILAGYLDEIFSCVNKVKEGKDEIEAMGVSEKVTKMSVTIDQMTALKAARAVLKKASKDADLKAIIKDFEKAFEYDGLYDEFIDMVSYALEEVELYIEDLEEDDSALEEPIEMIIYTASDGSIRGREVSFGDVQLAYYMPEKGKNFGFEFYFSDGWDEFGFSGSGKRSGDKLSGEFEIENPESGEAITLKVTDFNTKKFKQECVLNGTFAVCIDPNSFGMDIPELPIKDELAIAISFSGDSSKGGIKVSLELDGKSYVSVGIDSSMSDGAKVSVPSKSKDIYDWVEDIDIYDLFNILYDSDIPEEIVDELVYMIEYGIY